MISLAYASNHLSHQYSYVSAPQAPPSPPIDEIPKCSLPSISNLLVLADNPRTQEQTEQCRQGFMSESKSRLPDIVPRNASHSQQSPQFLSRTLHTSRQHLPPTPPMHAVSGSDVHRSPSLSSTSTSQHPVVTANNFHRPSTSAINNVDPHSQRQSLNQAPQSVVPFYMQPAYSSPQYYPSPQSVSSVSSHSPTPMQPTPPRQSSGMYYQQPLPQVRSLSQALRSSALSNEPQNFPPNTLVSINVASSQSHSNPWQHHHYISPSVVATFPTSQDRYICGICDKAFSRPSSLRIHSHSHTGEKPFRCPYRGCGKAFSVRSNMKRHERGCHGFERQAPRRP